MYKFIERSAWITGSLSLVGVILILFLQGMPKNVFHVQPSEIRRPPIKLFLKPITNKKPTPGTPVQEDAAQTPKVIEPEKAISKPKEKIEKVVVKPAIVKKEKVEPESIPPPESTFTTTTNSNALFAESELNQLVGKIQAEKIRQNSNSNCVQIRITADNSNTVAVAQVERFLTSKNYIITGREKEDFLRGNGLKVKQQGNCLQVTVGKK